MTVFFSITVLLRLIGTVVFRPSCHATVTRNGFEVIKTGGHLMNFEQMSVQRSSCLIFFMPGKNM